MSLWYSFIQSAGLSGFYASRVFLSTLSFALIARFGVQIPLFEDLTLVQSLNSTAPEWLVSETALVILGVLSVLELLADKSVEIREFMSNFDTLFKTTVSTIISFGLISKNEAEFISPMLEAGIADYFFPIITGILVFSIATIKNGIFEFLREVDSDDSMGIQKVISWFEDLWGLLGPFIFIVFPVLTLFFVGVIYGLIFYIIKKQEKKEEARKISCTQCGSKVFKHSTICLNCRNHNESIYDVNLFGFSKKFITKSSEKSHKIKLLAAGRCPMCASPIKRASGRTACSSCSMDVFEDNELGGELIDYQNSKLKKVILICLILSLFPIIGAIVGIIYYKLILIAPFKRNLPKGKAFFTRLVARFICLSLLLLQWVPFLGAVSIPSMAYISYNLYLKSYRNALRKYDM